MISIKNNFSKKIDRLIGRRILSSRVAAGLPRQKLAQAIGVTVSQIQKYENGTNRVGSGRLYEIAKILEAPLKSFFDGETQQKDSRNSSPFDLLTDNMTMQMAREFGKMTDNKTRRAILAIVETLVA